MLLKDKIIVITGAASGLGATLAEKVVREGAKVALVDIAEEKLQKSTHALQSTIGQVSSFVCDIRDLSQVQKTVKDILSHFGKIDILVNNAGIWTDDDLEKEHPERRKEAFDTNALGNIQFTDEVLPHFVHDIERWETTPVKFSQKQRKLITGNLLNGLLCSEKTENH